MMRYKAIFLNHFLTNLNKIQCNVYILMNTYIVIYLQFIRHWIDMISIKILRFAHSISWLDSNVQLPGRDGESVNSEQKKECILWYFTQKKKEEWS